MAIGAPSDSLHGDPNTGPVPGRVARSCLLRVWLSG